jgi:beta-glucosidase/6-phospho-beta-glucosidase/beta-galactosidase
MFHWDLPQSLMDLGGWLNADTAVKFGVYARFIFQQFGIRVKKWIPINEPLSVAQGEFCGDNGSGAPGEFAPHCAWSLYLAAKNLLLAHMEAWKAFQDLGLNKDGGILGMALNGPWFFPANLSSSDDIEASARAFDFYWGLFGHPLFLGDWAPRVKERIAELSKKENRTGSRLPAFTSEQIQALKGSAQFVGVNYYNGLMVTSRTDEEEANRWELGIKTVDYDTKIRQWPSPEWRQMNASDPWVYYTPFGLRKLLNYIKNLYNVPILITENGCMDNYDEDLNDVSRVGYLRGHLMAIAQALQDGVKVMGHTVWSLMDNFEWNDGYSTKFGIHRVNFSDPNRSRTPKASAGFYANVAKSKMLEGFSINSKY